MPEVSVGAAHLRLVLAMVLELYLDLLSQPCRAVYIFAKKNNIPFMMKPVEMLKGQHFTEEFNKVNILRKVPVLKDGDFILEESTAILLYLTRKYNTPSYWYPPDMKKRARVDEYLAWQISTIRAGTSKILWLKVRPDLLFTGGAAPSPPLALQSLQCPRRSRRGGLVQGGGGTWGCCFSYQIHCRGVKSQRLGGGCASPHRRQGATEWQWRSNLSLESCMCPSQFGNGWQLTDIMKPMRRTPLAIRSFGGVTYPPKTYTHGDVSVRGPRQQGTISCLLLLAATPQIFWHSPQNKGDSSKGTKQPTWQEPPQDQPLGPPREPQSQPRSPHPPLAPAWEKLISSPSLLHVSVGQVVIPLFVGHQVSPEKLYEAMEELNLAIQKLEDKFLQDKPFLIGPEISLADLVAIVELMQPLGAGCDILVGRPKLQEWRKRVELTLGKDLFMEAHNRILNPQELKSIIIDPPLKAQMKPLLLKMLK
ncbi:glutathione S-transferase theta-1-like [Thamnophis elegans]|uniref:glutathione S-transferase theta-1-like n=1 Tax=Thamnophis elegans TaxID=35005 RepID=UPI0013770CE3|nr:glutathione S-transferase theta-1-like [Thamnophis elegans]